LNNLLDFVMDAIESNQKIEVQEDRPNIPAVEEAKTEQRLRRQTGSSKKLEGAKYDWRTIFNGNVNVLEQGTDYDCKSTNFGAQCRNIAKRKGIKINIKVESGRVIVQAVPGQG